MRNIIHLLLSMLLISTPSIASAIEITPFGGYRMGGEFTQPTVVIPPATEDDEELRIPGDTYDIKSGGAFGIILGIPYGKPEKKTMFELFYSHQNTQLKTQPAFQATQLFKLDIDYITIGGTYLIGENVTASSALQPFVSAGVGISYFEAGESGLDSEIRPALAIGGGVKWMFNDQLGLRFELRGTATPFGLGSEPDTIFCGNDQCLDIEKNVFFQADALVGLVVKF